MRLLKILTDNAAELYNNSQTVTSFDQLMINFAQDLFYTMKVSGGIGLAAPQVGNNMRIITVDTTNIGGSALVIMINPTIISSSGVTKTSEGCLSFPGETVETSRFSNITVTFQDFYGNHNTRSFTGIDAVCIQHEIDHLSGITFHKRKSIDN